jgi:hypothetical protein
MTQPSTVHELPEGGDILLLFAVSYDEEYKLL